jgi:hypothetical protein
MKWLFCSHCGEVLFNTNSVGWQVVSQWLIAKCNDDELPPEICSDKHFFYEQRVFDIDDELPKYLRGQMVLDINRRGNQPALPKAPATSIKLAGLLRLYIM